MEEVYAVYADDIQNEPVNSFFVLEDWHLLYFLQELILCVGSEIWLTLK